MKKNWKKLAFLKILKLVFLEILMIIAIFLGYFYFRVYFQEEIIKNVKFFFLGTTALIVVFGIKFKYSLRIYGWTNPNKKAEFLKQEQDLLMNALYFITNTAIWSSIVIAAYYVNGKKLAKNKLRNIYDNSTFMGLVIGILAACVIASVYLLNKSVRREKKIKTGGIEHIYFVNLNSKK